MCLCQPKEEEEDWEKALDDFKAEVGIPDKPPTPPPAEAVPPVSPKPAAGEDDDDDDDEVRAAGMVRGDTGCTLTVRGCGWVVCDRRRAAKGEGRVRRTTRRRRKRRRIRRPPRRRRAASRAPWGR